MGLLNNILLLFEWNEYFLRKILRMVLFYWNFPKEHVILYEQWIYIVHYKYSQKQIRYQR